MNVRTYMYSMLGAKHVCNPWIALRKAWLHSLPVQTMDFDMCSDSSIHTQVQ